MSKPFTLEEIQRVVEIYRQYIGVRAVKVQVVRTTQSSRRNWRGKTHTVAMHNTAYACYKPRRFIVHQKFLRLSRLAQLTTIIHELCHFKTPKAGHGKRWKANAYLWGSAFQIRHVESDEAVRKHIQGGCGILDTWYRCDDCTAKLGPVAEAEVIEVEAEELPESIGPTCRTCDNPVPTELDFCTDCTKAERERLGLD